MKNVEGGGIMAEARASRRLTAFVLPSCLAAQIAGILLGRMAVSAIPAWIALALAGGAGILLRRRRIIAGLIAVCAVGMIGGYHAYHPAAPKEGTCVIRGVVCDEITHGDNGQIKTRLCAVTLDGAPAPSDAYWSCYPAEVPAELIPGCTVTFTGRAYVPRGAENPDGFDFGEYLLGQGMRFGVYGHGELTISAEIRTFRGVLAGFRHMLAERLCAVMGEEAGSYAAAMLLGAKQRIPIDDRKAFSRTGAAHVLVVSGFHVGVLAALLERLMGRCSLNCRAAVSTAVIAVYALLVGAHAPVTRALTLYTLSQLGRLLRRPRPLLWTLCACASITLTMNPAQLTSASFQLTYAAVLGMAVVAPWIPHHTLGYTLGAQAGVLLPVLYYFHEWPLVGVVLNIVLLPAASALISLYWLVLALLPVPPAAALLGFLAQQGTALLAGTVRWLNGLPVTSLWTCRANALTLLTWAAALLVLGPLVHLRGRTRGAATAVCAILLALSVVPMAHRTCEYILFSEGDADASLLWDKDCVVIVDAGEDGRALSGYLHQRRLAVDALILTHLHIDHAGGLRALLDDNIPVRTLYLPWGAASTAAAPDAAALVEALAARGTQVAYLARGDRLPLPSGSMDVLWPEAERVRPGSNANGSCLVLRAEAEGVSLLLTGDRSGTYAGYTAVPADVLKAAHHGAAEDNPPDFLAAVAPALILVPCARSVSPVPDAAVPILATGDRGAITLRLADGQYTVHTAK